MAKSNIENARSIGQPERIRAGERCLRSMPPRLDQAARIPVKPVDGCAGVQAGKNGPGAAAHFEHPPSRGHASALEKVEA